MHIFVNEGSTGSRSLAYLTATITTGETFLISLLRELSLDLHLDQQDCSVDQSTLSQQFGSSRPKGQLCEMGRGYFKSKFMKCAMGT